MPTRVAVLLASGFVWFMLLTVPARAAIDINGPWNIALSLGGGPPIASCLVDVTQTGSALTVSAPSGCYVLPAFSLSGTIDTGTGVFTVSGASAPLCATLSVDATANPTSTGFNGTFACTGGTLNVTGTLAGSLCGNGVVDPGEQCDPGLSPNACCDALCMAELNGTICSPANPRVCFVGMCEAGACQPVPREGACDDLNQCTENDQCQGLFCVGTPRPAGAACDLDGHVCTTDTCDGAGTCTAGPCSPCCDAGAGCTPSPATGCKRPAAPQATLQLKSGKTPKQTSLKWKWQKGSATSLADFGDPTATTDYTLCIFEPAPIFSPNPALLVAADAPAGGTCRGQPCWRAVPGIGFTYQDRDRTPNGIDKISLKAGPAGTARVQVSAKGENLIFGDARGIAVPWSVQLRASDGTCWESLNGRLKQNGQVDFNHGSPSGAFLD